MQLFIDGWGLAVGAQRSACSPRVNGCLNPGLIHRRSGLPNKHAHSWVEINISPLLFRFRAVLEITWCIFFSFFMVCRGGHRGHGVHPCRGGQRGQHQRRRGGGGGPLQPPEQLQRHQLHSHTFPQTAAAPLLRHRAAIQLPSPTPRFPPQPFAIANAAHYRHQTSPRRRYTLNLFLLSWPRLSRKHMGLKCHSSLPDPPDHWPYLTLLYPAWTCPSWHALPSRCPHNPYLVLPQAQREREKGGRVEFVVLMGTSVVWCTALTC